MNFNTFDFVIIVTAICGLTMVAGAIWLLRTGVIKLSEAAQDGGGLDVEVMDKIKFGTRYPAVALFLIGLCFEGVSIYFAKPAVSEPAYIVGKLNIDDASNVTVSVQPDNVITFHPDDSGQLNQRFDVEYRTVKLDINAAGYTPLNKHLTLSFDAANRQIALPAGLVFTKDTSQVAPTAGAIAELPAGVNIPLTGASKL
jgi:hypothetical protein